MQIAIPTMGRVLQQYTLQALELSPFQVLLFAPEDEAEAHRKLGRLTIAVPKEIQGIAATRHFIMETLTHDTVVMMDDDLTFAVRRHDEPEKFRNAEAEDVKHMLLDYAAILDSYAHASISMREGANRDVSPMRFDSRVARVIGYQRAVYFKTGADFRNSTVMDDFEVTLHLLTRGFHCAILNTYVQNQRGSGTSGGASLYRTPLVHATAAATLAKRYPRYVQTVQKTTKVAWGGGTRVDVVVQWKKAVQEQINADK